MVKKQRWSEETIKRLEQIAADGNTDIHKPLINNIVFWSGVVMVVAANLMIAVALLPVLALLDSVFLDSVIIVLGLVMGFLYHVLLIDIAHVEYQHRVIAAVLIPLIALLNIFFMVGIANSIADVLSIPTRKNPITPALLYVVAFSTPYVVDCIRRKVMKNG